MLAIAWALLGGWVLGLFGFKAVVIAGMAQIFGVTINALGYYFLFGMYGVARRLAVLTRTGGVDLKERKNAGQELGKALNNLNKKK